MADTTTTQQNLSQNAEQKSEKALYVRPELIVHGRVEKLTLATGAFGDPIPGEGHTGPGGSTVFK